MQTYKQGYEFGDNYILGKSVKQIACIIHIKHMDGKTIYDVKLPEDFNKTKMEYREGFYNAIKNNLKGSSKPFKINFI